MTGTDGSKVRDDGAMMPRDSAEDLSPRALHAELSAARDDLLQVRRDLREAKLELQVLQRRIAGYESSRAHRAASWASSVVRRSRQRSPRLLGRGERGLYAQRPESPLFDEVFYLLSNPDVVESDMDAWMHYCQFGWREGRDPNPLFDSAWYSATYAQDLGTDSNPLLDYMSIGWLQGRDPSPEFDTDWYLRAYPDVRSAGVHPLRHFLLEGGKEARKPSYRFSPRQYAATMESLGMTVKGGAVPDLLRRRDAHFLEDCKSAQRSRRERELDVFLEAGRPLALGMEDALVTVVVVVWNQAAFTLACLRSLAHSTVPVRIIVVDNASTDETVELLTQTYGITVIRNSENRGFLLAVNQVLGLVDTPFVILLNNDATVAPDAIQRSLEVLADPSVGVVGGRVLLPNGLLQEAGSFVDSEGRAHGYLRGVHAWAGDAMYQRPVDFCSGVFLALRSDLVRSLEGFDVAFAPAYGEEVDLCLRVWEAGFRVVYEPSVVIHHLEYGSSGDSGEPTRLMERNRATLAAKHPSLLDRRRGADSDPDMLAQMRIQGFRVLFVEDRVPREFEGAGFPRSAEMVRALSALGAFVTVLPMYGGEVVDWPGVWAELGTQVRILPEVEALGARDFVREHGDKFDAIWVCRAHNMSMLESVLVDLTRRSRQLRVIYDSECISALRESALPYLEPAVAFERVGGAIVAELSPARVAHLVVAVNRHEEELTRLALPAASTCVISEGVRAVGGDTPVDLAHRAHVLFVGRLTDRGSPNVEAFNWFVEEVLPLLAHARPRLRVVGVMDRAILTTAESVEFVGPVQDLSAEYRRARVVIAAQRSAAGNPHKVIDAAAAGVPVVATPLIAGQVGWTPGVEMAVADDPRGFASEVQRLLDDDVHWTTIRTAALRRVNEDFSTVAFRRSVESALHHLGVTVDPA